MNIKIMLQSYWIVHYNSVLTKLTELLKYNRSFQNVILKIRKIIITKHCFPLHNQSFNPGNKLDKIDIKLILNLFFTNKNNPY